MPMSTSQPSCVRRSSEATTLPAPGCPSTPTSPSVMASPRSSPVIKDHVILNDDPTTRENRIGLARVSTDAQELARQIDALKTAGCARIYLVL